MKNIIYLILKVLMLVFCFNLSANVYLIKNNSDYSRVFYSISKEENYLLVKKFEQEKGDYPFLVSRKKTKLISIEEFIKSNNLEEFKRTTNLQKWKIVHQKEFLFGFGGKPIWTATNEWNSDWELKFAKWIQSEVKSDFYKKYNIATDCADALVGLRWIFSRINSLPVANTLADTDDLFGNFSIVRKWSRLNTSSNWYEDELFLTALDYIMNLTSTRTVINDGYPIKLSPDSILAGSYIITQNGHSGHARIIAETNFNDWFNVPIVTLASTTPRQVRDLIKEVFFDQDWPVKTKKEILAFRWPIKVSSEWRLKEKKLHPRFSEEQFDSNLSANNPNFILYIISKINNNFDPQAIVDNGTQVIVDFVKQRVTLVEQGFAFCSKNKCPINSEEYDDWSTPSRDAKLITKFIELDKLVEIYNKLSPGLNEYWIQKMDQTKVEVLGRSLTLKSIRYLFDQNFTSSDPNLSPEERWGINPDKIIGKWLSKIESNFNIRAEIIDRSISQCGTKCFPKTYEFLNTNTYSVDAELNKLYVDLMNYCNIVGEKSCNTALLKFDRPIQYNQNNFSMLTLLESIPLFNSDPRTNIQSKWGIGSIKKAIILKNISNIKISESGLGILNFNELYDFNNRKSLMKLSESSRFIITNKGNVYIINDNDGSIFSYENNEVKSLLDPDGILKENKDRRIEYIDIGSGIFLKKLKDSTIAFRIKDNVITFINQYSGIVFADKNFVYMSDRKKFASIADLEKEEILNLDFSNNTVVKNTDFLKAIDITKDSILFEYNDTDEGTLKILLFNKVTEKFILLNNEYPNSELKYFSLKSKKLIIQNNPNSEFPELIAVNFKNQDLINNLKFSNNYYGVLENNDQVIILHSKGSAWEPNEKRLSIWGQDLIDYSKETIIPQFIYKDFIYFSNDQSADSDSHGLLLFKDLKNKFNVPKLLMDGNEFYQLQITSPNYITYRFNTLYGDYWGMGGGFNSSGKIEENGREIVPDFTYCSWINKESLLDIRWQKNIQSWKVLKGALYSNGLNMAIWWAE